MILISAYQFIRDLAVCNAVFPNPLPQQHPLPAISLEYNGSAETMLLDTTVQTLREGMFTVLCWDASLLVAAALAKQVHDALVGYSGPFGQVTAQHIRLESDGEGPENETGLRSMQMEFLVAYWE